MTLDDRVLIDNLNVAAVKLRQRADDAEGDLRRELRDLLVRLDTIRARLQRSLA